MKLIIADDERKILQLIEALVDWEKLGVEISGRAMNGIEALELVEKTKPDVVLTDIMMPRMDGLELIRRIKETDPDIRFIIISGYQDFEYARAAIRYGVKDFLTKPIQKDELERVVQKIIEEKTETDKHRKNLANLRSIVSRQSEQIKQKFLGELINGPSKAGLNNSRLEEINKERNCNFKEGIFQIIIVKIDFDDKKDYEDVSLQLNSTVVEICVRELAGECFELIANIEAFGVCVLLNYSENGIENLRGHLRHIRTNIAQNQGIINNIHVTTGVGCAVNDIKLVPQSFSDAQKAILNRIVLGTDKMIGVTEGMSISERFDPFESLEKDFKSKFFSAVSLYDTDGIKALLARLKSICRLNRKCDGYDVFTSLREIFGLIAVKLKDNADFSNKNNIINDFEAVFYSCYSLDDVFGKVEEMIISLVEKDRENNQSIKTKPIQQAKAYIQNHYREPIKLEQISEMVGFNPNYFSGVFKKETNQTLTEYILEVRLEKAKELLKNKNIKINEIPEQIGIGDSKYFARQFKKAAGLSPSQYRKFFG